jgi:quercetin 2,3-dioxygenase
VALPRAYRSVEPDFAHHADLPVLRYPDASVTVVLGELDGAVSGARAYTPIVGAEVTLSGRLELPLHPDFEYAVLVLSGTALVDDLELTVGPLLYLGTGRPVLSLRAATAKLLLLGGEPFAEQIVMWWNFVGGSHEDVVQARADWAAADPRFGTVPGYDGDRLPAPVLPATRLKPRGRHR